MKFAKIFDRQYNRVNGDEAHQQNLANTQTCPSTVFQQSRFLLEKQRNKSLKASRSMSPADILSTFFNERKSNGGARSPKCAFLLLAVGVLAIATAVMVKIFHPYDLIFRWKLVMEEGGEVFDLWAKPPVDLYLKVYLFNITNAEAFLAGREKMNVEQVGPYVYKEIMTHENISFNDNNTMSANPSHPLVWQEHMSEGNKEDDEVVMLNIAMLAISHLTADRPFLFRMGLNTLFTTSDASPIVRMTAKEFMFGYPSSLTTLGNTFLPNWIYFDKVGLIDRMYDFATDYETFHTGATDPAIAGLYATYLGSPNLEQWQGEHCSNIELASDGTKFKSFIQANETVKFFRKSMCRPVNLYRSGEPQKYGSLEGYKYIFEENALDNGVFNEKNKCFCRKGYCQPRGLVDVTDCYYGFPISLSFPHFMDADPGLIENVTGLMPIKEKHSSAFVIQPQSGLPLSISAKIQINMHFQNLRPIKKAARFSHLTAPMLWFEIMMPQLPESLDTRFNFYINILPYVDILGFWGGMIIGVISLAYAVTRATMRISKFGQPCNISDGSKYGKANLLQIVSSNGGVCANNVYNPCEMKLLNDKHYNLNGHLEQENKLQKRHQDDDDDTTVGYGVMNLKNKSSSSLSLDTGIVVTIDNARIGDDESYLIRSSTANSSIYDAVTDKEKSISASSSGFSSSLIESSQQDCSSSSNSSWSVNDNAIDDKINANNRVLTGNQTDSANLTTTSSSKNLIGEHRRIMDDKNYFDSV